MRKCIYILIALSVLALAGCKKEEKMPDYIPANLTEDNTDNKKDDSDTKNTGKSAQEQVGDLQQGDETVDDNSESKPVVGKTTTMYVKLNQFGGYLNVRPTPSTDGSPVGFLVHAEAVEVIEIKDGWASIVYKGDVCYVNASYLVEKQPAYLEPPTPTPTPKPTTAPATQTPEEQTDAEPNEI